ncbi:TAF5-like RNA polymerase II p300/CBP-associated factor-associated factor 65 kDa subunit 5L [Schistocerca serialis cubense]|uniref:TAF5-like RNA polymerase II p300/CBP-associated factor-associated factor 65 kDa subunit 5L n=1 Tax=Schistocerca serialis cubense TaxID=2023355 RepID=UPI00214E89E6|nr:TAF5-like RNA polymerase II p300/CBP-associated factor-associated factor 65 kDa subunit 5L [Schistocerca serialis cubense]
MKRSKSEAIKSALNTYLKRRHYADIEDCCKINTLPCSQEEMAVGCAVERVVGRSNSFTFSTINNDVNLAEQHFLRFKNWIAELKQESFQCELASLLCPMFCHLYLEMLCGGHRQVANKFFKRHQVLFTREHNRPLLEELASVTSSQDIENNALVKDFRSCKYHVKLSEASMACLQIYLSEYSHTVLIQLLQDRFSLEVDGTILSITQEKVANDQATTMEDSESASDKETESRDVDEDFKIVREAIEEVFDEPKTPTTVLYTIKNCEEITACGRFTNKLDKLAVGMGSVVKLWSLTNKKLPVPKKHVLLPFPEAETDVEGSDEDADDRHESDMVSLFGHCKQVQDLRFVNEEKSEQMLLSVSHDATMRCWTLGNNICAAIYRGHNRPIWSLDVDSLGMFAVTGSSDYTARLWSLDRTYALRVFIGHTQDVESVSYHPSCKYIATGSTDKTVRLWTVSEGKLIRIYAGHRAAVQVVRCSPNGKYIASAGEDKRIKIWDIPSASTVAEFKGHSNAVVSLSWTPDSEYLASCALDGTIRQWNVARCVNREMGTGEDGEGGETDAAKNAETRTETASTSVESHGPTSPSASHTVVSVSAEATPSNISSSATPSTSSASPGPAPVVAGQPIAGPSSATTYDTVSDDPMEGPSTGVPTAEVSENTTETASAPVASSPSPYQSACFSVGDHILCVHHVSKDTLAAVNITYIDE